MLPSQPWWHNMPSINYDAKCFMMWGPVFHFQTEQQNFMGAQFTLLSKKLMCFTFKIVYNLD
jgi:hypothetical protein